MKKLLKREICRSINNAQENWSTTAAETKKKKKKTENTLELKTWTCIQKDTLWYYVSSPMSQLSFVCVFVIIWTFILMNFDVLVDVD